MPNRLPVEYLESKDQNVKIVALDYSQLTNPDADYSASIKEAYGYDGLGLLVVKGVPNVAELRGKLLPLAHKFANFSEDVKEKTVHKESFYSFGWSHGKEFMSEGKPDFSKGSYYNNPLFDTPTEDQELVKKYPSAYHPNIWPHDDLPELQNAFKDMGRLVVDVGQLVARQCDVYVNSVNQAYANNKLHQIIRDSKACKARLLHYFPLENAEHEQSVDLSSWCGWHNDHGSLTGLVPAMYINREGKEVPNPDPNCGLYIKTRAGVEVKAVVPTNCLAFQIGETACIHSGGILQATPHAVRAATGPNSYGVSRETFAVFMEPDMNEKMEIPDGASEGDVIKGSNKQHLPPGVPLLEWRWNAKDGMDFGDFTEKTLKMYYTT